MGRSTPLDKHLLVTGLQVSDLVTCAISIHEQPKILREPAGDGALDAPRQAPALAGLQASDLVWHVRLVLYGLPCSIGSDLTLLVTGLQASKVGKERQTVAVTGSDWCVCMWLWVRESTCLSVRACVCVCVCLGGESAPASKHGKWHISICLVRESRCRHTNHPLLSVTVSRN